MAKDERLWMRFPIDMHRDPKVTRLGDKAFRVFFEMNGEARLEGNDGIFDKVDAEFRWDAEVLAELVSSHPTEPLVIATDEAYSLRRFARHQMTEADRAVLAEKRANAGKAGAQKRWGGKPVASDSKPMASAIQADGKAMANDGKAWLEKELELEQEIEIPTPNGVGARKRATRIPEPFIVDKPMREWAAEEVPGLDIDASTRKFVDHWRAASGQRATKKDWTATWRNWLRNDLERMPTSRGGQQLTAHDRQRARQAENLAVVQHFMGDGSEPNVWEIEA